MNPATTLLLRAARREDAYTLWLWANDPATRSASFDRGEIPWDEHVQWLERQLASDDGMVLMAGVDDGEPVGSIRFDTADGWRTARLSYVVAPEARGRGYGAALVRQGVGELRAVQPATVIEARVRGDNAASLRVFRGLGWNEQRTEDGYVFSASAGGGGP